MSRSRGRLVLKLAVVLGCLTALDFDAATSRANVGRPYDPGAPLIEIAGGIKQITIQHEQLTIDLRPLDTAAHGTVTAVYRLYNPGPSVHVHLVFATPALPSQDYRSGRISIRFDGTDVPAEHSYSVKPEWNTVRSTPIASSNMSNDTAIPYDGSLQNSVEMELDIPSGEHTLSVDAIVQPAENSTVAPIIFWQLAYLLSPAKDWKAMDTLDVSLYYPPDWSIVIDRRMDSAGAGALNGHWVGMYGNGSTGFDAIALTLHAPTTYVPLYRILLWSLRLLGIGILLLVAFFLGKEVAVSLNEDLTKNVQVLDAGSNRVEAGCLALLVSGIGGLIYAPWWGASSQIAGLVLGNQASHPRAGYDGIGIAILSMLGLGCALYIVYQATLRRFFDPAIRV